MHDRMWSWSAVLMLSLAACGSSQRGPESTANAAPAPTASGQTTEGETMCPMRGSGAATQVRATDTNNGVALVFTTTGDVADLRARVRQMAAMQSQMMGMHGGMQGGGMQGGMHGEGGMQGGGMQGGGMQGGMQGGGMQGGGMQGGMQGGGMMRMQMVPSTASVEDVPGGARVVLVPTDPSQLAALRQQARMRAQMMQQGNCPLMASPSQPPRSDDQQGQHHPGGA